MAFSALVHNSYSWALEYDLAHKYGRLRCRIIVAPVMSLDLELTAVNKRIELWHLKLLEVNKKTSMWCIYLPFISFVFTDCL